MNKPIRSLITAGLLLGAIGSIPARAQTAPSSDTLVDLQEGVYRYLQARTPEDYNAAIQLFSSALERERGNQAALLFRALSRGQIGLRLRGARQRNEITVSDIEEMLRVRANPDQLRRLEGEVAAFKARMDDPTLDPSERLIAAAEHERRSAFLSLLGSDAGKTIEQLQTELHAARKSIHETGAAERVTYQDMIADLELLVRSLDRPEAVIRLLEVIAQSKVARLDEDEAMRLQRKEVAADQVSGGVRKLRSSATANLRRAAQILEDLLKESPTSKEDLVRAKFFLGVIRYRQAVPKRGDDESAEIEGQLLAQAERIMGELADDESVDVRWRSYASLYLGLIIPFRAGGSVDVQARGAILDEADRRLTQAAKLDTVLPTDPAAAPTSDSGGGIPILVARQRAQVEQLRAAPPTVAKARNDLALTLTAGAHRDTNVVLLGGRTDLPRDVSRKRDYGFTGGLFLDYTLDLSDRWTLAFQGRTTQLWHADVDEFDEQRYGGSVALQYELVPQKETFGPVHLRLQYDYDYSLLGRDPFLESQSLTPNLRVYWNDRRAETNVYFSYSLHDYREALFDRRFDRDGEYCAFGGVQSFKLVNMTETYKSQGLEPWGHKGDDAFAQDDPEYPARYLAPYFGLQYAWDATEGDEFDQKEFTILGGVLVPLPWGVDFDAGAEFAWQEYQHGSLIDYHRRARRDFIQRYSVGLSRSFVLRGGEAINRFTPVMDRVVMTIRLHSGWTLDDSNVVDRLGQSIFEYDRVLYGITVAFGFN